MQITQKYISPFTEWGCGCQSLIIILIM